MCVFGHEPAQMKEREGTKGIGQDLQDRQDRGKGKSGQKAVKLCARTPTQNLERRLSSSRVGAALNLLLSCQKEN